MFHSSAGIRPRGSTRHSVIFGVGSDPHPRYRVRFELTQRSIMVADSHRDEVTFALKPAESERGVRGIRAPKLIILDRELLHVRRQFLL